jgi:transcription elongation factor Elf1
VLVQTGEVFGEGKRAAEVGVTAADCSACGAKLDAVTTVAHDRLPKVGDVTVCAYCGQLYQFELDAASTSPLVRRPITDEDLKNAAEFDDGQLELLAKVRRAIGANIGRKA